MPNTYVMWEGPSLLTGDKIVCLVSGVEKPSTNSKTGPMSQVWVMHAEVNPLDAIMSGRDEAVCGSACDLRGPMGKRECYVNPAPLLSMWMAYRSGSYSPFNLKVLRERHKFHRRGIRLGAYGEMAAMPIEVSEELLAVTPYGHTAYTSLWREADARFKQFSMASVSSVAERIEAKKLGYRTYRKIPAIKLAARPLLDTHERPCPGAAIGGKRTTCAVCRACDGSVGGLWRSEPPMADFGVDTHSPAAERKLISSPLIQVTG